MYRQMMVTAVVGVLVMSAVVPCAQAAKDIEWGFVDVSRAFDDYQRTIDSESLLEEVREEKQQERDRMVEEIKTLRAELELMSEEGRVEKRALIEEHIRELQEFERSSRNDLRRRRDQMAREILGEMQQTIAQFGSDHDYTLIFDDKVLLYKADALDLTDQVLKVLNKQYTKD